MRSPTRRRTAALALLGLLAGLVPVLQGANPASAGTSTNDNACFTAATATFSTVPVAMTGTDSPDPVVLGNPVTLSGSSVAGTFSAALFVAGYRLGLLNVGDNAVSANVTATILASNTTEGSNSQVIPTSVTVTIIDPTPANRSSGDESAVPLTVTLSLANTTWTPTGGNIVFTQGTFQVDATIGALAITLGPCLPSLGLTGCDAAGANCTGFTPNPNPTPFETTTVNAPPTAPVCTNESLSVGAGQSIPVNLVDNCTDVNGNIDLTTFTVSAPSAGTLTGSNGLYTYQAPATDPGAPVTMTFTVADTTALVSNVATLSITILANSCDATASQCSLTEIVVQQVIGAALTLDKAQGIVQMSDITLNGNSQASSGNMQDVTVTNRRGTAAGWSLTGFVTDLGAPGGPTITLPTGQTIPNCSAALGGSPHRLCIPGDNLGWDPTAAIAHDVIPGDVAQVAEGPAHAADAAAWLADLRSGGANGLGGLLEANVLCSSPVDHSGGTFACDAALFLGVPASAGAGTYTGGLVLTLL